MRGKILEQKSKIYLIDHAQVIAARHARATLFSVGRTDIDLGPEAMEAVRRH